MRVITSVLVHLILSTPASDESLLKNVLSTLTNVAVLPTWHKEMGSALHKTFNLLDEMQWKNDGISYQALRLLINLSCNEEMIPNLLAAQVIRLCLPFSMIIQCMRRSRFIPGSL
jgi:Armadillo-like